MKHPIINKILTEWAYRVHDGMPNPKNSMHLVHLRDSLEHLKIDEEVIDIMMTKLYEDQQKPLSDKDKDFLKKKGLVWKGYAGGYGKEGKDNPVIYKNVDGQLQKVGDDEGQSEEEPQQEPEQQTQKVTNIETNPMDKGDEEEKETNVDNIPEEKLRDLDHKTTDKQLLFTKAEANAQAEKKGPKGGGLGTAESRAGEAAVHYAVRELLKGRSIEEVRKNLLTIANDKDRVLNKEWAEAAINTAEWIHDVYGDDVKEVVWDTPSGRQLIGVEGHGTSSDMFIQTKDGKNIGISLKQTTAVFLLNGGYPKQHEKLINSLREQLEPDELEEFERLTSIENYNKGFISHLTSVGNNFENNQEFNNIVTERINFYKTLSDEDFVKLFDSTKYRGMVDRAEEIIRKLPHVNSKEKAFIGKILKDPAVRDKFPEFYDNLRNEEVKLTQSILTAASSNPNVANGLKKICLDGMHIEDILFGKSSQLDEFVTLYGNKPAVELSKGVLLKIFGMQEQYEMYLSIEDEEQKEIYKEQLLQEMMDKLVIDIKDGAKAGEVKIIHEEYGEFHLFGIKARAKGLGASPALEMYQTSFMGNVIKEGTTDISQWKDSTRIKFVKTSIKTLMEEMEDASEEQREALKEEIKKLEALI